MAARMNEGARDVPFGGVKDSGIGREGIRYAIEDMTELRVLLMKNVGVLP